MPLEQELQTFHEQKEHLLEKYKDRFVLIKGDEVVADFESRGDALREGIQAIFGHEAFLVKKVEEVEQVNFIINNFHNYDKFEDYSRDNYEQATERFNKADQEMQRTIEGIGDKGRLRILPRK